MLIMGITTTSFDAFFNLFLLIMVSYVDERRSELMSRKDSVLKRKESVPNEKAIVF
jgi:hypothetical protein